MRVCATIVVVEKQQILFIQNAQRMRRIVLSSVASPAIPHFPYNLINGAISEKCY